MGKVKLQLLTTTEDTKDNVVSFTSGDTANPSTWKDVAALASNENHKSILNKISTMFNNVRYLYKILGTTDISTLGTVTQAISTIKGNIGDMKGISSSAAITTQGQYALDAREKNASVDGTLANQISTLNSNLDANIFDISAKLLVKSDSSYHDFITFSNITIPDIPTDGWYKYLIISDTLNLEGFTNEGTILALGYFGEAVNKIYYINWVKGVSPTEWITVL